MKAVTCGEKDLLCTLTMAAKSLLRMSFLDQG
jgi:hypothetical protein